MKAVMAEAASQRLAAPRAVGYAATPRPGPPQAPFNSGTPEGLGTRPKSGTSPAWRTSAPATPAGPSGAAEGMGAGPSRMPPAFGMSAQMPATPSSPSKTKPSKTESPRQQPLKGLLSGTRPPSNNAAPPSPAAAGRVLGPVITPTRQTPTKSGEGGGYGRSAMYVFQT